MTHTRFVKYLTKCSYYTIIRGGIVFTIFLQLFSSD